MNRLNKLKEIHKKKYLRIIRTKCERCGRDVCFNVVDNIASGRCECGCFIEFLVKEYENYVMEGGSSGNSG